MAWAVSLVVKRACVHSPYNQTLPRVQYNLTSTAQGRVYNFRFSCLKIKHKITRRKYAHSSSPASECNMHSMVRLSCSIKSKWMCDGVQFKKCMQTMHAPVIQSNQTYIYIYMCAVRMIHCSVSITFFKTCREYHCSMHPVWEVLDGVGWERQAGWVVQGKAPLRV